MGTTAAAAGVVRLSHLLPCPNCAADNGVTARICWSCEGPLQLRERLRPSDIDLPQPAVVEPVAELTVPAEAAAAAAAVVPQRQADPEPSFFPMLPDEAAGFQTAANDHPDSEPAVRSMRPRNSSRRVTIVAVCGVSAAMVLGIYLIERSVTGGREARLLARVSSTAPAPEIAAPRHDDALTAGASPKPAAAKPVKATGRAVAPAAVDAPAPAKPSSCAPQVFALGLCDASSR